MTGDHGGTKPQSLAGGSDRSTKRMHMLALSAFDGLDANIGGIPDAASSTCFVPSPRAVCPHDCAPHRRQPAARTELNGGCGGPVRAKMERLFRVIKRQFGYVKVRCRGLTKNGVQLLTLFALPNRWEAPRMLLAARRDRKCRHAADCLIWTRNGLGWPNPRRNPFHTRCALARSMGTGRRRIALSAGTH